MSEDKNLKWVKSPMSSVGFQQARNGRNIMSITNQDGFYKLTHQIVGSVDTSKFHFETEADAQDYAQSMIR
ncbi:hypothetical protein PSYG_00009 [Psychrobacter phage pOW20-A]|uniref:hypothetical protein n=1 Tax=Psychrobacter phage pOW20-A TaxID=754048 RepID=UPI0002C183FD|nr:hypothetical protein PSYG_00009 [Psychrobacter phage pOW20-A]AGH57470.1 hypothetical protein PSYG_00009 [Psychrobacter phage pOW20-A]